MENGVGDFGDLRCEGPVCDDPGRPPDGIQISTSYEQGSEISFQCTRPRYIPVTSAQRPQDVVGRPTEIRFFYKQDPFLILQFPPDVLRSGQLRRAGHDHITSVRPGPFVILGIVAYDKNP